VRYPRGDGDGWARCSRGHRHWGVFGAAGLLLWNGGSVLLQHRAEWSHHGGTWGILGGARNSGESAAQAAAREAAEEAGVAPADYRFGAEHVDDHGGWAYTTVVAHADRALHLTALTPETIGVRWVPAAEVVELSLHPGFAATWDVVRRLG
jgi:8-oxo-dGTP diphosphatase